MVYEKLSHIQTKIKAPKNLHNSFGNYDYRNAESILQAAKPFLESEKCSLTLDDEIVEIGTRFYVKATATLTDIEGATQVSVSAMAREEETKRGMDGSQITGSASSYARKYALNGLFLLDDTKDADTDEQRTETNARIEKEKPKTAPKNRKDTPEEAAKNEQMKASVDPVFLPTADHKTTKEQWERFKSEQTRTGITDATIKANFGVTEIENLTQAQVINALNMFKKTPDKK